jgi:hypothetical protein
MALSIYYSATGSTYELSPGISLKREIGEEKVPRLRAGSALSDRRTLGSAPHYLTPPSPREKGSL